MLVEVVYSLQDHKLEVH